MSGPIVFISRHRIKEGKLEELRKMTKEGMAMIEADKPGTAFQCAYVSEDTPEVSFVHIFPAADAVEHHMVGVDDQSNRSQEVIKPVSIEIFRLPSEKVSEMFKQIEARGISLTIQSQYLGGFSRFSAD